jgi:hypothetical protein
MWRRWMRTAARRASIARRFTDVICVDGTQSFAIQPDWRAQILTTRRLVFLEPPSEGDLCDTYALATGESASALVYTSPDARELWREQSRAGRLIIAWLPREPIRLYTVYEHHNGWMPSVLFNGSAVCAEYHCDMRTGTFTVECTAPVPFEAAVVLARPRWARRVSERRLVRAALDALNSQEPLPAITQDGQRVHARIETPHVGERYVLVAFRRAGVATCEQWLKDTSLVGRVQRRLASWLPAFGA